MGKTNEIIAAALAEGRTILTEIESKKIIREESIAVVESRLAMTKKEARDLAAGLGFPVAVKVVSPDITHKSDIGGVVLNLENATQVGKAYDQLMARAKESAPDARVWGVSVQKMARPGVEVAAGMSKDVQFGPVLMFGLGGVFVEVLKDVSFRIVPLSARDAGQMVREIKGYPVLEGYRGRERVDIDALEDVLLKLSGFVERTPQIKELDLNPIIVNSDGAVVADARVILEPVSN